METGLTPSRGPCDTFDAILSGLRSRYRGYSALHQGNPISLKYCEQMEKVRPELRSLNPGLGSFDLI